MSKCDDGLYSLMRALPCNVLRKIVLVHDFIHNRDVAGRLSLFHKYSNELNSNEYEIIRIINNIKLLSPNDDASGRAVYWLKNRKISLTRRNYALKQNIKRLEDYLIDIGCDLKKCIQ